MAGTLTSRIDGAITPDQARHALAEAIRGHARWRGETAQEYPEDARNPTAARALERLAAYTLTLLDADERLRDLTALVGGKDVFHFAERASRALSRFGFDGTDDSPDNCDRFLMYLVGLTAEDELELAQYSGEPPLFIAHRILEHREAQP